MCDACIYYCEAAGKVDLYHPVYPLHLLATGVYICKVQRGVNRQTFDYICLNLSVLTLTQTFHWFKTHNLTSHSPVCATLIEGTGEKAERWNMKVAWVLKIIC